MPDGLDVNADLSNYVEAIVEDGYSWVGRYIRTYPLGWTEAMALKAVGLDVVSIWEQGKPVDMTYFGQFRGHYDAARAIQASVTIGQPVGTPIYFAVDYDAAQADLFWIGTYFKAVQLIVKDAGYFAGVYGSGTVCQYLTSVGYISHTWLAASKGWCGHDDWLTYADIVQGGQIAWYGMEVNTNTSKREYGGWQSDNLP